MFIRTSSARKEMTVAQKVQVVLVDDVDGGKATETVSFALDGTSYEIDLSTANASKFRDALGAWVGVARKAGRGRRAAAAAAPRVARTAAPRARKSAPVDREQTQAVRAWAKKKGYAVNTRGRIAADIIEKYNSSH
jgi:hypothetical protein